MNPTAPPPADACVAIDIGNSRTRAALYRGAIIVDRADVPSRARDWRDRLGAALRRFADAAPGVRIAAASVMPARTTELPAVARTFACAEPLVLRADRHAILPHDLETIATTGVDRLCAARAAWRGAHSAVIVVDAGTAVTVDLVDGDGVFRGGGIFPGAGLLLQSLRAGTAQLPDLSDPGLADGRPEIDEPPESPDAGDAPRPDGAACVSEGRTDEDGGARSPSVCTGPEAIRQAFAADGGGLSAAAGRSTKDAIRLGVRYGLAGAVERIIAEHLGAAGPTTPVVLTGGAAEALAADLSIPVLRAPDLVLDGIRLAAETVLSDADGTAGA